MAHLLLSLSLASPACAGGFPVYPGARRSAAMSRLAQETYPGSVVYVTPDDPGKVRKFYSAFRDEVGAGPRRDEAAEPAMFSPPDAARACVIRMQPSRAGGTTITYASSTHEDPA